MGSGERLPRLGVIPSAHGVVMLCVSLKAPDDYTHFRISLFIDYS